MAVDLTQFHAVFFEEAAEHLADMERRLLALDPAQVEREDVDGIFRAAHSIKGGANMFGFAEIAQVTHELETLLDAARRGSLAMTRDLVEAALGARDYLDEALAAARAGRGAEAERAQALCADLRALAGQARPAAAPEPAAPAAGKAASVLEISWPAGRARSADNLSRLVEQVAQLAGMPAADLQAFGEEMQREGRAHLALSAGTDLERLREGLAFVLPPECVREPGMPAPAPDFGFFEENLPERRATAAAPAADFGFFEENMPEKLEPAPPSRGERRSDRRQSDRRQGDRRVGDRRGGAAGDTEQVSIRVSAQKIDRLINLTGEMMIGVSMIRNGAAAEQAFTSTALSTALASVERNMRELQEAALSIRMIPIAGVFARFPRLVHDLSARLGKDAELRMEGESTELDRGLMERIIDPLTHLVRNSLDHGIEPPALRAQLGKPARGTIWLRARHESGNVVIEVEDDGAGLPREKILRRAREMGMQIEDGIADLKLWELIFAPGFSTADQISDVSGRGVGMDVVRRNVREFGGHVEVGSQAGQGTRMTVRLPLTLAIMDGMELAVGAEIYILPLNAIVESLRPAPEDLKSIGGARRALHLRGEVLPILPLGEALSVPGAQSITEGVLVVVENAGRRAALAVDALLGQQQVVVKNLEANFRRVPGLAGATILGSGTVGLILDVEALVQRAGGFGRGAVPLSEESALP
ncbi:MAG TPA: chemotaxis protein CheW [Burkholderiales bacterium]|nr:chemotaxis protein CheW [Burkholderiales bacterium]